VVVEEEGTTAQAYVQPGCCGWQVQDDTGL
jgi:hypothetical protein